MKSIAEADTHYEFIDGLRGIAILMTLMTHWDFYLMSGFGEPWKSKFFFQFVRAGTLAVSLFFLISAFTLFHSTYKRFRVEKNRLFNFYFRRLIRIWPLWWLALLFYSLYYGRSLLGHPCCLFMYLALSNNHPHLCYPGWTLFVEETFYIFLPFIILYATHIRRTLIFLALAYSIRLVWFEVPKIKTLPVLKYPELLPPHHWYTFIVGILLYFIFNHPRFQIFKNNKRLLWLVSVLVLLALPNCFANAKWGPTDYWNVITLALLFLCAGSFHGPIAWLSRKKIFQLFGISCYSIYLFHMFLIDFGRKAIFQYGSFMKTWPKELLFVVTFPVFALLMLGIGTFLFNFFEYPIVRWGRKLLSRNNIEKTYNKLAYTS